MESYSKVIKSSYQENKIIYVGGLIALTVEIIGFVFFV